MRTNRHLAATVSFDGGGVLRRLAIPLPQSAQLEPQIGDREPLVARPPQPLPLLLGLKWRQQDVVTPSQFVIT